MSCLWLQVEANVQLCGAVSIRHSCWWHVCTCGVCMQVTAFHFVGNMSLWP